jgi:glycogen synthase
MSGKIAFISYETPFAPCGGVAAVMKYLPAEINKLSRDPVYVITPYHRKIERTTSLEMELKSLGEVQVLYKDHSYSVEILLLDKEVSWIFIKTNDPPDGEPHFFSGTRHPYDVGEYRHNPPDVLQRDALFFGVAARQALGFIDPSSDWDVLMQDWEAATFSLFPARDATNKVNSYLTLHNSYDSRATPKDLRRFGIKHPKSSGNTVLERTIAVVKEPIFTVSEQFALDFSGEILESRILAPHISPKLQSMILGINNGPFTLPSLSQDVLREARDGNYSPLAQFKSEKRAQALQALRELANSGELPIWGDPNQLSPENAPWFVMAGRDDSRQKGFDIFSCAIDRFLSSGGKAHFLLFPIPGDEGLMGIQFLNQLAREHPRNVIVLPFVFTTGYLSAIQGASFGVMPSLYEPFGMANEYYLNGTVCIGRATGGILQQIVPYRQARSFTNAVRARSDRWFEPDSPPTGLLFRERDSYTSRVDDWQAINDADKPLDSDNSDRLTRRLGLPLFEAMVSELTGCLQDAAELYSNKPDLYYPLIVDGFDHIRKNFSWEKTARAYLNHLDRN